MAVTCNDFTLDACGNTVGGGSSLLGQVPGGSGSSVYKLIGSETIPATLVSEGFIPVVYVEDVNLGLGVYGFNQIADILVHLFQNDFAAGTLNNADFALDTAGAGQWVLETPLVYSAGTVYGDGTNAAAVTLSQEITLVEGRQYNVTFDVTGWVANGVAVNLGGGTPGTTRSADGTFGPETITAGAANSINFVFEIAAELAVDNVIITPVGLYKGTVGRPVAGAFCIEAITDSVIGAGTTSIIGEDPVVGTIILADRRLYGNFDSIQITSGSVRVYSYPHRFYVT